MDPQFRNLARHHLNRAKKLLEEQCDDNLRYAVLELRFSIEALVYDRAFAYKNELPPDRYRKWQPRELLKALAEISPRTLQDVTLSVGKEEEFGVIPDVFHSMGTDIAVTQNDIRKNYEALGSFLHQPTIQNIEDNKGFDITSTRNRCDTCVAFLERILSSRIWNVTLGSFSSTTCTRCSNPLRRRLEPDSKNSVDAACFYCPTTYTVTPTEDGATWKAKVIYVPCPTQDCTHTQVIWEADVAVGTHWLCPSCNSRFELQLGVGRKTDRTGTP